MNSFVAAKEITPNLYTDSIDASNRGACISVKDLYNLDSPTVKKLYLKDEKMHDANFAVLSTTLAKVHQEVYEPLHFTTYAYDIDIDYGGGFVDFVSYKTIDYAGMMNVYRNFMGNNANYIPRVNAALNQKRANVYTFEVAYDLRFIELEKMSKLQLEKDIKSIYNDVVTIGWDLFAQKIAYTGAPGSTGLFNSDSKVLVTTIDNSAASAANKGFKGMNDDDVAAWLNGVFETYIINSNNNSAILPDTFLVPTFVGRDLVDRGSPLYTSTLRKFLEEHNLGVYESEEPLKIRIRSRSELNTLGTGGHGRIVAYRKDKRYVRLDVPYALQHYVTMPNIEKMSYTTAFAGQISELQMPYNVNSTELGIVTYWDFTK